MSDIFNKRLKDNIGNDIKIYLKNDFRFEGPLLGCDEKFIEIFDIQKNHSILVLVEEIKEVYFLGTKHDSNK